MLFTGTNIVTVDEAHDYVSVVSDLSLPMSKADVTRLSNFSHSSQNLCRSKLLHFYGFMLV